MEPACDFIQLWEIYALVGGGGGGAPLLDLSGMLVVTLRAQYSGFW